MARSFLCLLQEAALMCIASTTFENLASGPLGRPLRNEVKA